MHKAFFPAIFAISSVCALSANVALADPMVADGKLTFAGQITDVTCTVHGDGAAATGVQDITVQLPTVSADKLANPGDISGSTPFSLILGAAGETNCANGKVASLHFEPALSPMVNSATGRLTNTVGTGFATNVEVGLRDGSNTPINLYTSANSPSATISANTATLGYIAHYQAVNAGVTAGEVNTNVIYSVTYN